MKKSRLSIALVAMRLLAAALSTMVLTPSARAQSGVGDIVWTVGTVVHDANNQDWAYILWRGTQPSLTSNSVYAVYSKAGFPTNNNVPYVRQSIVRVQTDARTIEPLLRRGGALGDDLNKLQDDLSQLFAQFMPSNAISRGDQLSAVIRGSMNDASSYQNLLLLAGNHCGINLALGFADAELIPAGFTTFEVRAYDPNTSQDLAVIGRVTVQAGNPTVLPAPGPPVLVPVTSPMGDLNLKFRWGTPDNLRRLGLMQFGFNLYRVTQAYAIGQGWNAVTSPPNTVLSNLAVSLPSAVRRVNKVPITPSTQFELADAAMVYPPGDTNTSFIMDDDGRGRLGYTNYGFTNGAEYFYYVTARDILGRDGTVSPGYLATVCDRMPPYPPIGLHVINTYSYNPGTMTSNQFLQVNWKQNLGTNDPTTNYWIYRWTNDLEMNALSGNYSNNLIAIVPQIPGATNNSYVDNGPGSPGPASYGETYWYTIRAGDAGACGQNLSEFAGPAYGVLRKRTGPPAATNTSIEFNCARPVVTCVGSSYLPLQTPTGTDPTNFDAVLNCTPLDPRFEWAEFYGYAIYSYAPGVPQVTITNYFGPFHFIGGAPVSAAWSTPRSPGKTYYIDTLQVWCRAALANGKISTFCITNIDVTQMNTQSLVDVEFQAGTVGVRTTLGSVAGERNDCIEHDPNGGSGPGGTNGIIITAQPTPGSAEYRFYRRVDSGPLSLLCSGAVSNLVDILTCYENAPPVNGGTICFYLQLLDINGNPGPMTSIGCIDTAPATPLPTPVLTKITSLGDQNSAGMTLNWFCPPYGVQRFEVRIAGLPTAPNTNAFLTPTSVVLCQQLSCTGAPPSSMVVTNFGTNQNLPFYSYRSPLVGPGFGNNGAVFTVPCSVDVGKLYYVTVRAVGKNNNVGSFSEVQTFIWNPTNVVSPVVPWPARGLPPASANFSAPALFLSPASTNPITATAAFEGNAVFVGGTVLPGRTLITPATNMTTFTRQDFVPASLLETNTSGDSIFPCVLYRYQVANANFPVVSTNTIQVSPLMENIAYQRLVTAGTSTNTIIQDPFIAVTRQGNVDTTIDLFLWLVDTQPIISGARYQYVLVRFKPNHEIDQLIPSNTVDVP